MKYIITALLVLVLPIAALAGVGVGVNLGKINVDQALKPGGIYSFPSIGVINTGDTAGEYEVAVTYHHEQAQLKPSQEWFSFEPSSFHLEPGASKNVAVKLSLPVKVKPGEYFCYLEAHPVVETGPGTSIGVAAATKTYFTIAPANIWQAMYYRVSAFLAMYAPWTYVILAVAAVAVIIGILRKHFAFHIGIKRK